jgi:ABC-2 type transport system permease protein
LRKLWVLALKEVRLAFRDVGAILTMLATPLALTLAIAAAFGGGGSSPIADIPVLVLNQDTGQMSGTLVDALLSDQLGDLLEPEVVTDEAAARARVEADQVAALVVIPPDFSARLMPVGSMELRVDSSGAALSQAADTDEPPAVVEVYASPQWRISTAVVKAVVGQVLERMHLVVQGYNATMGRLILVGGLGAANQDQLAQAGQSVGEQLVQGAESENLVRLEVTSTRRPFNWLDYSAASMAILFLMFSATAGGRTLLAEREGGTLPRLLVSPTPAITILVGKMAGVALTGILQVMILWGASSLLIGAYWGEPLGVAVTILALVLAATGVGALIAAWAKTPQQAGAIGTAVTLVAAALSGSFFPRMNLPAWVQRISMLTPNAWGIELFTDLQAGDVLADVLPLLGGLLLLTLAYYVAALIGFRRQFE